MLNADGSRADARQVEKLAKLARVAQAVAFVRSGLETLPLVMADFDHERDGLHLYDAALRSTGADPALLAMALESEGIWTHPGPAMSRGLGRR